jgi:NAD(P)H-quinone oxidoreductase subunit 5
MQHAYWLVLLPFVVGAFIIIAPFLMPTISRDSAKWKTVSMILSVGAVFLGAVQAVLIFSDLAKGAPDFVANVPWFVSDSFTLTMGVLVDKLTAVMLIVVTMVSLLVQIYTHAYMREDPGYSRFYAYLSLFTGSMLGLVVATNLFQLFFFWELVGVCSYFLIGFWWYKNSAAYACLKAFVVNRIGDFGFLIGILLLLHYTWGFWAAHPGTPLLAFSDPKGADIFHAIAWACHITAGHTVAPMSMKALTILACLMFMGPMAKSAQMPLHVWLPDAMEGPTPISALIHAATMVAAGIYMVARAYPIWLNWANPAAPTPEGSAALAFVAWIGGITAFMAATIALTQNDIKRALAWSTVSQLGYMFVGLGVGGYTGGMFHLFTHAFFKAMLFLCSGAVIHALHGEQNMQKMGGLWKDLKSTSMAFLFGCLAISGWPFPPFSGFFSKDEIIGSAFSWGGIGHEYLGPLLVLTAGLTAFYMFRMFFMTFSNEYRGDVHPHAETSWFGTPLTAPLGVLMVPSFLAGYLGMSMTAFLGEQPVKESAFASFIHWGAAAAEPVNWTVMLSSVVFSLTGILIAFLIYKARTLKWNESLSKSLPALYQFSYNRWYWDDVYHGGAAAALHFFKGIWTLVDSMIIDDFKEHKGGLVNWVPALVSWFGGALRTTQNGRGQYYALVIFACVAGISLFVYFTRPGG